MFAMGDQMLQSAHTSMLPVYRKWKSNPELAPNCPRCASANTKFCYYNNYSLSQPRYFCKGCRRYWTKGGSLRNVPVGGGCRKTRRGKSSRADKDQLLPMNYGNHGERVTGTSCSSDGDSGNQPTGSDIDLAVIFAQFVNQTSTSSSEQPDEILTQEWSNEGIDPWSFLEQGTNSHDDSSMELPVVHPIPESCTLHELPQVKQHLKQGLLETDEMNDFGLQNGLADDVFWSNYEANTPSFECQPMVHMQQFESFPVDDQHLKISANLMAENWSSFDLSGFELYSKP